MSPRGRVRAILVALAHFYVVLTSPPLSERPSYFLPFPDCVPPLTGIELGEDDMISNPIGILGASAVIPPRFTCLPHANTSDSNNDKNLSNREYENT